MYIFATYSSLEFDSFFDAFCLAFICAYRFVHYNLFHFLFITPHAQRERGKVIGRGVHIYICGRKKNLNRTLEIDSPFQTLTVGLLVEFID